MRPAENVINYKNVFSGENKRSNDFEADYLEDHARLISLEVSRDARRAAHVWSNSIYLQVLANLRGLVLGFSEADFCKLD